MGLYISISSWIDKCGYCYITYKTIEMFRLPIVLMVACIAVAALVESSPLPQNNGRIQGCKPGTTFKVDCNHCFCTKGGFAACTKMFCFKIPKIHPLKGVETAEGKGNN